MELPKRKAIRLKDYDYSSNGAYFITVCVKDMRELLGETAVGDAHLGVPYETRRGKGHKCVKIPHIKAIR